VSALHNEPSGQPDEMQPFLEQIPVEVQINPLGHPVVEQSDV